MDFMNLFLSPKGRIGQTPYWVGNVILIVGSWIIGWVLAMALPTVPIVGSVISLVLLYFGYCVMAKRFQDFGKPGTLAAVPFGILALLAIWGAIATLGLVGAAATGSPEALTTGAMAGLAGLGLFGIVGFIVWLVFLIWAGVMKGDPATNAYGPPSGGTATA